MTVIEYSHYHDPLVDPQGHGPQGLTSVSTAWLLRQLPLQLGDPVEQLRHRRIPLPRHH